MCLLIWVSLAQCLDVREKFLSGIFHLCVLYLLERLFVSFPSLEGYVYLIAETGIALFARTIEHLFHRNFSHFTVLFI